MRASKSYNDMAVFARWTRVRDGRVLPHRYCRVIGIKWSLDGCSPTDDTLSCNRVETGGRVDDPAMVMGDGEQRL